MDIDEIVETSDIEELEELQSGVGQSLPEPLENQNKSTAWERIPGSPPRKRLKLFHDSSDSPPTERLGRLSVSPIKSTLANYSSPLRSRSSSNMLDTDSASSLSASSRSSQTSVNDIQSPDKQEQENPAEGSQDPFLLRSPAQKVHQTPTRSPLGAHSVSDDQMHTNTLITTPSFLNSQPTTPITPRLSSSLRSSFNSTTPALHTPSLFSSPAHRGHISTRTDNEVDEDELLMFTPSKPTSSPVRVPSLESLSPISVLPDSPATSVRAFSPTPLSISGPSSPAPAPAVPIAPQQEPVMNETNVFEYEPQESRYSLRKRNVAQLNPFTVENMQYKLALKSNPEAIVNLKVIERHINNRHSGNHYEHDGKTQQDIYMDEGDIDDDASREEKKRRRLELHAENQRRRPEQDTAKYPDILQDLSDSEGEGLDAIAKEARRARKQLEKEKRAREKEERRREREEQARKAKRFPVQNTKRSGPKASTSSKHPHLATENSRDELEMENVIRNHAANESSRPSSSPNNETRVMQEYFQDDGFNSDSGNHPVPVTENHRPSGSPSFNQAPVPKDYFGGDDFEMYNQDPWTVGDDANPGDDTPAISTPPINVFDEEEEPSQPDDKVSDIELDLPPQKQRWLRKMYPKSMIKTSLLKNPAQDGIRGAKSKRANDSKRRAISVTSDDDQPLLPGQSRVQKAANPKDIREIKGDSESESEREIGASFTPPASPKIISQYLADKNEADSDSDVVEILETYRPRTLVAKKEKHIEEIFSSEDEIDDEDIEEMFFSDEQVAGSGQASRLRDESLIDYMLTRWRNIGGTRKKRVPSSRSENQPPRNTSSSSSKYKIDITTRGARGIGRSRQTLLSFDGPETTKKRKHQEGFTPQPVSSRVSSSNVHSSHTNRKHASSSKHRSVQGSHLRHIFLDDDADSLDEYAHHNEVIEVQGPSGSKSKPTTWKEKEQAREKTRRKRARMNGVWSNNMTGGQIITSGANRSLYTVAVEQDEVQISRTFHFALAPDNPTQVQREHWSKQFKPPKSPPRRIRKAHREYMADDVDDDDAGAPAIAKSPSNEAYTVDLHINPLHSGRSFGATTDIGKGWLYELVNLGSTMQEPVQPITMHFSGYIVNPDVTLEVFCAMLPQIIDSFFEFVTALPDPDQETTKSQWTTMGHAVCQHISWYLHKGEEAEIVSLRQAVEGQITQIVERINQLALSFVDTPVMAFGWFAVEMAVRIGFAKPTSTTQEAVPRHLKSSSTMLMDLLLQLDVRETMKLLQDAPNLEGKHASHYAAELWVCLIHVLSIYLPKENASRNKSHPFWSILLEALRSRAQKREDLLPAEASEITWSTIFSLCALSQFSTHGITSGRPRLPACWDAAVFALRRIRLTVVVGDTNTVATQQRDAYVAIVVKRCLLLHERWKWTLHDASPMFNTLSDIFKSRKFANLWHEQGDFADFFKCTNWDLLLSSDPKDTAYNIFLKLIVRAAHEDPVYIQKKTSPKVKKWLSLAVPLGNITLPEGRSKDETQHSLSMFYNRLSAVAIAVDLDAGEYDDRTLKARKYIDFANADHTTRFAVIRGMTYWSIMMVARGVKLNAIVEWIQEIATVIETDLKRCHISPSTSANVDPTQNKTEEKQEKQRKKDKGYALLFANFLLATVRHIIDAHAKATLYPEPSLISKSIYLFVTFAYWMGGYGTDLAALKPVLMSWIKKDSRVKTQVGLLAKAIFAARSLVLPPPPRPPPLVLPVNEESQESQDFGMDDFGDLDWDNIDLPEALAPKTINMAASDITVKDAALLQALTSVHFKWIIGPFLKPSLQPPPPHISRQVHESDCDDWVRYFLCCSSLEPQANKWDACLRLLDMMIEDKSNESWTGRVHLSIMFQLLKLDPMAYLATEDRAMEVFMWALVSDHVAIEKEYVAQFLSVAGLRHPLLHGATLPSRNEVSGDFSFLSEEFMEARFLYVETIFQNLNRLVHQQLTGQQELALDNTRYIDALKTMLSSMRSRLKSLKDSQKRASYQTFCHRIFSLYQECPELLAHVHLRFWVNWRTILTNNP